MKPLARKLLIPLSILSLLSLGVAYLFNRSLDYASIFLNLATDLVMVIVTIYYVDDVLKKHEEEKWSRADFAINARISTYALLLIQKISIPLGLNDRSLTLELGPKLYNPRGTGPPAEFLYFVRKLSREKRPELEKRFELLTEDDTITVGQSIRECPAKLQQMVDVYGNRLAPEVLEIILEIQDWVEHFHEQRPFDPFLTRTLLVRLADLVEATKVEQLEIYMDVTEFRDEITGRKYPT